MYQNISSFQAAWWPSQKSLGWIPVRAFPLPKCKDFQFTLSIMCTVIIKIVCRCFTKTQQWTQEFQENALWAGRILEHHHMVRDRTDGWPSIFAVRKGGGDEEKLHKHHKYGWIIKWLTGNFFKYFWISSADSEPTLAYICRCATTSLTSQILSYYYYFIFNIKKQMCACRFYIFNYFSTVGSEVLLLSAARLFELMSLADMWVFLLWFWLQRRWISISQTRDH